MAKCVCTPCIKETLSYTYIGFAFTAFVGFVILCVQLRSTLKRINELKLRLEEFLKTEGKEQIKIDIQNTNTAESKDQTKQETKEQSKQETKEQTKQESNQRSKQSERGNEVQTFKETPILEEVSPLPQTKVVKKIPKPPPMPSRSLFGIKKKIENKALKKKVNENNNFGDELRKKVLQRAPAHLLSDVDCDGFSD